ncbi:hypothetical protein Ciccas_012017 [Cichlidogyrus casuarinus]|uniref:Uncharacterized protein n=1 Tax=Cichlidogyrus casuarinus TaxID=1844966 RepID=A0ABD2PPL6_9PLAT
MNPLNAPPLCRSPQSSFCNIQPPRQIPTASQATPEFLLKYMVELDRIRQMRSAPAPQFNVDSMIAEDTSSQHKVAHTFPYTTKLKSPN